MTSTLFPRLALVALVAGSLSLTACRNEAETPEAAADTTSMAPAMTANNVVDVAAADAQFSTLVDLVQTANLDSLLRSKTAVTLFAPTNDAFAKLPAGTVDTLKLEKNRDRLTGILLYHLLDGQNVKAADIASMTSITTAQSGAITTATADGKTTLTDATGAAANVVQADVDGGNGTIHVIDTVLMPSN